jgi:hypothetical protein
MEAKYQNGSSKKNCEDADWADMAQNAEKWWAFVNMVMNLQVPYTGGRGEFLP